MRAERIFALVVVMAGRALPAEVAIGNRVLRIGLAPILGLPAGFQTRKSDTHSGKQNQTRLCRDRAVSRAASTIEKRLTPTLAELVHAHARRLRNSSSGISPGYRAGSFLARAVAASP